jgi:hypothetical protein
MSKKTQTQRWFTGTVAGSSKGLRIALRAMSLNARRVSLILHCSTWRAFCNGRRLEARYRFVRGM